ncbi:hypothetical protein [Nonomuraea rhodomycinica]|nr:hypothetical protein [Nonomuraea rhodomycinica]
MSYDLIRRDRPAFLVAGGTWLAHHRLFRFMAAADAWCRGRARRS